MPFELSLAPDPDRGGHVYTAALARADDVRELSEWIADAKQNPDVAFVVDVAAGRGTRLRRELRALLRRHDDLRETRRLTVVEPARRGPRRAATATTAALSI